MGVGRIASTATMIAVSSICATVLAAQNPPPVSTPGLQVSPPPEPNSGEWHKAGSTHRQATFPQTTTDGRYWFRFNAPNARSVQLDLGGRRYDYQKDENGVWNLFTPYDGPGVRYVTVYVDGVPQPEPGTHVYYSNGWKAALESPAPGEDYYAIKDVPHGDVREHWFRSAVTGSWRRMFVYTPPGYDQEPNRRYPVLYLQHGAGEMEQEWTHSGLANFILDNLIAEGKAVPMIIVMNNGFANRPGELPAGMRGAAGRTTGPATGSADEFKVFEQVLLREVIPDIDANFRTIADREHRAMAGLSMGSRQTYHIGLRNLDTFSQLGIFSAALFVISPFTGLPEPMKDPVAFNERVPVFFLSAGTAGSDERIHATLQEFYRTARAAGIDATFVSSPGTTHDWQTWRRSLHAFARLLFRK